VSSSPAVWPRRDTLDTHSPDAAPAGYPEGWEGHVVLADGGLAFVRPVRPEDFAGLGALHERMSRESQYLRYFSARRRLPASELMHSVSVDYRDRMAFVAFVQGRLAAYACYVRPEDGDAELAEIAFQVEDAQRGRGLGTLLLERLAAFAHERGLHRFTASVLPHNRRMIEVFRDAGFPRRLRSEGGVVEVTLEIDPTRHSRDATLRRHAAALRHARERIADAKRDRP
jgi:RimJ/RimL family protein N-acetyltransferase